eukprot:CAMPEP_0113550916 /NCGR_PEP_ID=MMETSP0015_2-20120614/14240_1 /TAXON_ID=2838 /ORGANISM="Odontella" /LENGTH=195 /DNA_ID=CAMNT_0000451761 /DNA_START=352 /DNA_END=936 /DNA_ORIENTATION=- /assembly_acc=CAM_ASM_000160
MASTVAHFVIRSQTGITPVAVQSLPYVKCQLMRADAMCQVTLNLRTNQALAVVEGGTHLPSRWIGEIGMMIHIGLSTFVILMLVICCCCCVPSCFNRESADMMSESIPVAVPYISSGNPPPTAPTWTQEAEYVDTGRSRGGGAMGGIAPALGGLAVGTVIGNIMGRHNRREGFSGPGNTDYGAVGSSGTYDIQGD